MTLLSIQHLTKTFPIEGGLFRSRMGSVRALEDVSFSIEPGKTVAIVGGSGCGKSTLAKLIMGLYSPDSGQILWQGQSLETFSRQERAQRMQMIFQDPFASLNPKLSVGTQLQEVIRQGNQEKIFQLLADVGLESDAVHHYPFQFSGGQRQRIAIARALAMNPQLLIADEPLSSLDMTIQAQILNLLKRLKKTHGLTMLFITHDLAILENFADRIIVLKEGSIVEEGTTSQILSRPNHPYTQSLLQAVPHLC